MANNLTMGPAQVFDNSAPSINQALRELAERIDELKGLRGRAQIFDRARIDSPTEQEDAVNLQTLAVQEIRWRVPLVTTPTLAQSPGTTYVEISSGLRTHIDFDNVTSPQARMIMSGFATETGSGKGVALTNSSGVSITEVGWADQVDTVRVGGFASVTEDEDQQVQLRVKGASASDSIVIYWAHVEFKGVIQAVSE